MITRLLRTLTLIFAIGLLSLISGGCDSKKETPPPKKISVETPPPTIPKTTTSEGTDKNLVIQKKIHAQYAGSASCEPCHKEAYDDWKNSHHALAERAFDVALDGKSFEPAQEIKHGTLTSKVRLVDGFPELTTQAIGGETTFKPKLVFGVHPLRQLLIEGPGGRLQATELAFDPRDNTWFNVYGDEDRRPGEWGHWTGRGMNWNSMCASCHNTRLFKNYNWEKDTYNTIRAEMGVGCEACHGPAKKHVEWQQKHGASGKDDPTIALLSREESFEACGPCHARRGELTGDFVPGEKFLDHYLPVIPDETDIYYPDGQVRDEDYEFVSFLSSEMHTQGVRCFDCHNPHSAKRKLPGNELCLQCHKEKIDPLTHGNHPLGKEGSFCYDCHMPLTTYMQRHARRDHGFTIPDPTLTRDFKIPNACNRCHADQSTEWAIDWVKKWYGDKPPRHTQQRARTMALARQGDLKALDPMIELSRTEKNPMWRAIATGMLRMWIQNPKVEPELVARAKDPDPLVRSVAVRNIEMLLSPAKPELSKLTQELLKDPSRAVRVGAAWSLRQFIDPLSQAGKDLYQHLRLSLDQPGGSMQMGILTLDRGFTKDSLPYFERAIHWDPNSSPLRYNYAIALSMEGRTAEAAVQMEAACQIEPRNPNFHFSLGLAYAELNRFIDAEKAFQQALKLDANHSRAWYNLGQIQMKQGRHDKALETTQEGAQTAPDSPDFPYAEAYILYEMGRYEEAIDAANRAIKIVPSYEPAKHLIKILEEKLSQ